MVCCYSGLWVILLSIFIETTLEKKIGRGDSFILEKAVENWISSIHLTERHFQLEGGILLGNRREKSQVMESSLLSCQFF